MRIIAGTYKSRIIKYPKTQNTRPTKDNVRLAIFNVLGDITNKVVLDLFSGSGAYGIEAISRGASYCYFNDKNYLAYKCILENLSSLTITNYHLSKLDYEQAINYISEQKKKIDIVFLDPPYYDGLYDDVLDKLIPVLNEHSVVIVEIDKRLDYQLNNKYFLVKEKIYGDQKILFISLKGA